MVTHLVYPRVDGAAEEEVMNRSDRLPHPGLVGNGKMARNRHKTG